jgi:oxygen-independent coproporphyrinogen III oxidase
MSFGVYIHIPYCIQRCTYCDFATYEQSRIMPPQNYVELLLREIKLKAPAIQNKRLDTIYFGGGTPSLIPAELIVTIVRELEKQGFETGPHTEFTIEINPATLDSDKMKTYLDLGVNRFSVGAQTFNDKLLKSVNREHNAQDTLDTLTFLKTYNINFSFDVLFGLPGQTLADLKRDLDIGLEFSPSHVSPYCLTVPNGHPLSKGRPPEDEQIAMFDLIDERLLLAGLSRYEISNYAKPGLESRHNLLYWMDQEYLGLGLSAHSYSKTSSKWGVRYWNPSSIDGYKALIDSSPERLKNVTDNLPDEGFETLLKNQALTDFCHISLRLMNGLDQQSLLAKFDQQTLDLVTGRCQSLVSRSLLEESANGWRLSKAGITLSNLAFSELTFLANELPAH